MGWASFRFRLRPLDGVFASGQLGGWPSADRGGCHDREGGCPDGEERGGL